MPARSAKLIAFAALLGAAILQPLPASANDVGGPARELIGAPVFAADGPQVGEVVDVLLDEEDQPRRIRMTAASLLGLGARTLELPHGTFTVLRGAVVLDVPAEAVQSMPEQAAPAEDR
jgi:hypothetical protein